ncbi:MAG TPA: excinuclease ABC subunit UvrC [Stellaceae bacterium]|nr:excinuclease ABC subunit UvrC [Stellaceae bacterium]
MSIQSVDPAKLAKAPAPRRRKAAPLDPRRSPGGLSADAPPDLLPGPLPPPGKAKAGASGGTADGGIARGVAVLRAALRNVPASPGVYRMLDRNGDAMYVGKARNLKSRVQNYTHPAGLSNRLRRMVAETAALEIVVAATEAEALLLECNLIKRLMPRYNVLLRDDKSFPFIHLSAGHDFPQLTKFRGARDKPGAYFGPFASAGAVNRTLVALQKAFLLRSCSDSMFANRTRPCLLYQIKRCSAPCVGRIGREDYARLIEQGRLFLSGRSDDIQQRLAVEMEKSAEALDFEAAALIRDRIRALSLVQGHQDIHVAGIVDADVIAAYQAGGQTCVQVFFFRGGHNWGNRAYFPSHDRQLAVEEVLSAFIGQFYESRLKPPLVLLSHKLTEQDLVAEALSLRGGRVRLAVPQRGDKKKLVDRVIATAREALGRRLAESASQRQLLDGVAAAFGLDGPLARIEVYDNSHIQGSHAVGAMIVAGPEGLMKNAYRKFTIRGIERPDGETISATPAPTPTFPRPLPNPPPHAGEWRVGARRERAGPTPQAWEGGDSPRTGGDDYAMMREVFHRRFGRALKEDPERDRGLWPDLVLIDGGQGQLSTAQAVLGELGIEDVAIVGIAKGPERNAGRERFFLPGRPPFSLEPRDPVLYFLQRLRDEAHRFVIGAHRAKRAKAIGHSPLDEIPGIGARRKQALLHHFGSARAVARGGLAEIERVTGISRAIAKKVYDHFHADG